MTVTHPARFSDPILPIMSDFLYGMSSVLDPFAGTGRIHELRYDSLGRQRFETVGVELEPEWAAMHPDTVVGNAKSLPFADLSFDATATSPCYGNRMADAHNAQERCKPCDGTGSVWTSEDLVECPKCKGVGRRTYKRITYTHYLGRKLHPDNAGAMQWGAKYRDLHRAAWAEMTRVTRDTFVLNISDHIRDKKVVEVTAWHLDVLDDLGWTVQGKQDVDTKRMGFGANRDARVPYEHVLRFEKSAA